MKAGQDFLFHSVLSPYINIGLLSPREVCEAILAAYHQARRHYQQSRGLFGRFWAGAVRARRLLDEDARLCADQLLQRGIARSRTSIGQGIPT